MVADAGRGRRNRRTDGNAAGGPNYWPNTFVKKILVQNIGREQYAISVYHAMLWG